jgi:hypothetical protein
MDQGTIADMIPGYQLQQHWNMHAKSFYRNCRSTNFRQIPRFFIIIIYNVKGGGCYHYHCNGVQYTRMISTATRLGKPAQC